MQNLFPIESHEADAPFTRAEMAATQGSHYSWQRGIEPVEIPVSVGRDPAVISVVLVLIILTLCTLNHFGKMISEMAHDLFSLKVRENIFDDESTTDSRTYIFLFLQLFVSESLLLYSCLANPEDYTTYQSLNLLLGKLFALTTSYYLFQMAAYSVLGYVFAPSALSLFLKGFNASQGLLSISILMPAMASVFYPEYGSIMVIIGAICYIFTKICFIIKGIRIFYQNFFSWLYFILYLCTVEIIPMILVGTEATNLCGLEY